jgi:hypothetical protein
MGKSHLFSDGYAIKDTPLVVERRRSTAMAAQARAASD